MWDLPRYRKPFYRRIWFVAPLVTLLLAGFVGLIFFLKEKSRFEAQARNFDFTKLEEMESASLIFNREGKVIGRIFVQNRDEVPLSEISPHLITAVLAAEDARFYQHTGVDFKGILRATVKNLKSGRTVQGASTITQQLARNSFPNELPASDRSYDRKALEMAVAREIERRLDKRKILELYLNRVFFGASFYGVEAAARGYFQKHAKDLTLSESAMLAGLLKSPNRLNPWKNRQACVDARNYVLHRARELELITDAEYEQTMKEEIIVKNRRPIHQDSYAADLVARQVEEIVGRDSAVSDGYRIYTTIDSNLQSAAEKALRDQLDKVERRADYEHPKFAAYDARFRAFLRKPASETGEPEEMPAPDYLQGAVTVIDNSTGAILALVGGRDFRHSEYNRALYARRPSGTAFKPLVYAAAFEKGFFPGTVLQDAVLDNRQVMIGGTTGILGEWGPERIDNRYEGAISARDALVKSKNAATVRLGMLTGIENVASLAKKAGVESKLRMFPATYLGSSEVTLMEMTVANTIFPNGGWRPAKPYVIDRIEEKDGKVIYQSKPDTRRVISPTSAYEVHSCLSDVLERGTADRAYTQLGLKRVPLGGKTGTAYDFTDLWFLGYSGTVTCGVWVGFDKPRTIYRGAFSNDIALPVWAEVMKESFEAYPSRVIQQPPGLIKVEICSQSGLLATPKCADTTENSSTGEKIVSGTTYFEICTEAQAPREGCDVHNGGMRDTRRVYHPGDAPRAQLAVNLAQHAPIQLKAPTVIGDDPYDSVMTVANVANASKFNGQVAPVASGNTPAPTPKEGDAPPEIRRAQPARPADALPLDDSPVKLDPPEPLQFD